MQYANERRAALSAVAAASHVCRAVQSSLVSADTLAKKDRSPVTVADFGAQAVISLMLGEVLPDDPIVGEEDTAELRSEAGAALRHPIVEHVASVLPGHDEATVLDAIDRCNHPGGGQGRHWTVDPIDGTKGFLRGDQYAVALGLIEDGQVVLGVLGCPNLPVVWSYPDGPRGCLFVGVRGQGAFMLPLDGGDERPVSVADLDDPAGASFCESVESGHSSHSDSARVADLLGVEAAPVRIDSQCKYAAVARGDAAIYLRLPTRKDYEEKIWDHAAGWMVIREAGGQVTDVHGKPLDFSLGRTLAANKGVVATNGRLHDRVVAAVVEVLGPR